MPPGSPAPRRLASERVARHGLGALDGAPPGDLERGPTARALAAVDLLPLGRGRNGFAAESLGKTGLYYEVHNPRGGCRR